MDMEKINKCLLLAEEQKPVVKLNTLTKDVPFKIVRAKVVQTKFGEAILIELEENCVFLPARSTVVVKDHLLELGNGRYSLMYIGEKDTGKGNPAVLFKFVKSEL